MSSDFRGSDALSAAIYEVILVGHGILLVRHSPARHLTEDPLQRLGPMLPCLVPRTPSAVMGNLEGQSTVRRHDVASS